MPIYLIAGTTPQNIKGQSLSEDSSPSEALTTLKCRSVPSVIAKCRWAVNWTQFKVWAHDFRFRKGNYNSQWRIASSDDIWCSFPKVQNKTYLMFINLNKQLYKKIYKYTQHCSLSARFFPSLPKHPSPKNVQKLTALDATIRDAFCRLFFLRNHLTLIWRNQHSCRIFCIINFFVSTRLNLQDLCNFYQWLYLEDNPRTWFSG